MKSIKLILLVMFLVTFEESLLKFRGYMVE